MKTTIINRSYHHHVTESYKQLNSNEPTWNRISNNNKQYHNIAYFFEAQNIYRVSIQHTNTKYKNTFSYFNIQLAPTNNCYTYGLDITAYNLFTLNNPTVF